MRKSLFWVLSFIITVFFAVFQRMTGPTYPLKGSVEAAGKEVSYKLARSCETGGSCQVLSSAGTDGMTGRIYWRRFRTSDPWAAEGFTCAAGACGAKLPSQPPAGSHEPPGETAGVVTMLS